LNRRFDSPASAALHCGSLTNDNGILRGNNVIELIADTSVLKIRSGEPAHRCCAALFKKIERKS
jgi:hypothetical protein